jgi:hypothetical protein
MENIHNNLMKLGESLGNVPKILKKTKKKLVIKTRFMLDCWSISNSTIYVIHVNGTLGNGLPTNS